MCKYDELHKGDYLWSNNKEYKAVFQVNVLAEKKIWGGGGWPSG